MYSRPDRLVQTFQDRVKCCSEFNTDTDHYSLWSYTNCTRDDHPDLKGAQGLIYLNDQLLVRGLGFIDEYIDGPDTGTFPALFQETPYSPDTYPTFVALEGTVLRVFHAGGQWHIATNRALDAFKCWWSNARSFGDLFEDALACAYADNPQLAERMNLSAAEAAADPSTILPRFLETLDPQFTYFFTLQDPAGNRSVSIVDRPRVYFMGTDTLPTTGEPLRMDMDIGISYPWPVRLETVDEVQQWVRATNPGDFQGLLFHLPNGRLAKYVNWQYSELRRIRGNDRDLFFRYLNIRMNVHERALLMCMQGDLLDFDAIENALYTIARELHKAYVDKFIRKLTIPEMEPTRKYLLSEIQKEWYARKKAGTPVRVDLEMVLAIINAQKPGALFRLLKGDKEKVPATQ